MKYESSVGIRTLNRPLSRYELIILPVIRKNDGLQSLFRVVGDGSSRVVGRTTHEDRQCFPGHLDEQWLKNNTKINFGQSLPRAYAFIYTRPIWIARVAPRHLIGSLRPSTNRLRVGVFPSGSQCTLVFFLNSMVLSLRSYK